MRKISKGNVTIKLWDIGGQPRFRSMWERYCRGVNAIVYMVDAADHDKIEASKNELHNLLEKPQLAGIPILVLGNKRDLEGALDENPGGDGDVVSRETPETHDDARRSDSDHAPALWRAPQTCL